MIEFLLNHRAITEDLNSGKVLLDYLREEQGLTGTKYACREGDCGACMVLSGQLLKGKIHYQLVNSCLLPLALIQGRHIVSIEGLNSDQLNLVQQALVEQGAIQCGFCTPGFVIAVTAFLLNSTDLSNAAAIEAVAGNLCRCTGYMGIKRALQSLTKQVGELSDKRIQSLIELNVLPAYFADIPQQLAHLSTALPAIDPNTVKVSGGTDLFVQQAEPLATQKLSFIAPKNSIQLNAQQCTIAATTTLESLRLSTELQTILPSIEEDFKLIGSSSIRQQATLAGNFVNASPIADLSIFFLALEAQLTLSSANTERKIALKDFFLAYKKIALQADEIISSVDFYYANSPCLLSFEKVSKRRHLDIASVNSAMSIDIKNDQFQTVHISAGGVAATPLYLQQTCEYLLGKKISIASLKHALELAQTEVSPIADVRGSVDYKRLLLRQLLIAHWLKLIPEYVSWEDFR
ncbi:MAG: 2Fe-2S iron-sulfur cluster binding domain-containing protein [Methyloprofundus sp.]|nr:2Fe-2S iron-sulfur cluster binding domain-containing protein [Methyloprofundus sp.]